MSHHGTAPSQATLTVGELIARVALYRDAGLVTDATPVHVFGDDGDVNLDVKDVFAPAVPGRSLMVQVDGADLDHTWCRYSEGEL